MNPGALFLTCAGTTDPLRLLLRGGAVQRYHTENVGFRQNVAEHTWRLMVILRHLWPDASKELLLAVLYHDAAEGITGDIPAPAKRAIPHMRRQLQNVEDDFLAFVGAPNDLELSPEDRARFKCADYLELCFTCSQDSSFDAKRIFALGVRYVGEAAAMLSAEEAQRVAEVLESFQ